MRTYVSNLRLIGYSLVIGVSILVIMLPKITVSIY